MQVLSGAHARAAKKAIDSWLVGQKTAGTLKSLDDEMVKRQAMTNGLMRYPSRPKRPPPSAGPEAEVGEVEVRAVPIDDAGFEAEDILIRELSSNRSGQADIGKAALTEFFGYKGKAKDIVLQHVSEANEVGPAKKIWSFSNVSRNYRLELSAISEFTYQIAADGSRMILVATKLDRRSFRYTILPITSPNHAALVALLGPIRSGRRLMREKRVTGDELRDAWPTVPANLLPVSATTPPP